MTPPVFRFAPSPNGFLHLGHAASALLNQHVARQLGGRLLLRIEDIDPQRSRPAFEQAIVEDLAWIGLTWEEPLVRQSDHLATYAARLEDLARRDLVYRCFCSRADTGRAVAAAEGGGRRWPRDPDGAPLHAGPCADLRPGDAEAKAAAGEPHAWRLRMDRALAVVGGPPSRLAWDPDGRVEVLPTDPARWGDVVLARRDVPTSYHLSVVVDDARQGITHVVRGRDLEPATDVHRVLQALLGLPEPLYHHHPLLLDADGRKLAKSRSSLPLRELRARGWTPAAVRTAALPAGPA